MNSRISHPALDLLLIALILTALILGRELLVPLVLAFLLWFLVVSLRRVIGKIKIGPYAIPKGIRTAFALLLICMVIWLIGRLVAENLEQARVDAPKYNDRFQLLLQWISEKLNVTSVQDLSEDFNISKWAQNLLNSSLNFISAFFVVVFYVVFIFLEEGIFIGKVARAIKHREQRQKMYHTFSEINEKIHSYLAVKSLLSLTMALLVWLVLVIIGVDFAIVWALFAFLSNFIPFIGAFISTLLPTLLAFLQFDDPTYGIVVFSILVGIQALFGNIIEPKVVGKSVNLSPLVVILSLAFWGAIWGVAGMFLCVPITVTLMIVLNQFESTKPYAILLSAGREIEEIKD